LLLLESNLRAVLGRGNVAHDDDSTTRVDSVTMWRARMRGQSLDEAGEEIMMVE
jgi:hypothetical protein